MAKLTLKKPKNKSNSKTNSKSISKKTIKVLKKKNFITVKINDDDNKTGQTKKEIMVKEDKKEATKEDKINKSLEKYIPLEIKNKVYPKNSMWELPNRKHFYNWVNTTFAQYDETNKSYNTKQEIPRIKEQNEMRLNTIQRLTRDYLQDGSPMRGLLLYVGLGHGKTCASIAIAEAIYTKKEVLFVSKANLEENFRKEIKQCGTDYFKKLNHWVFNKCEKESEKRLAKELGITEKSMNDNKGVFFIDFTNNNSNYNDLTPTQKEKLDKQINDMINNRFKFLHYDAPNKSNLLKEGIFDNKIVIVDEVHNLGNTMNSKSVSGKLFYKLFMDAKNPKYVFLSGTPIINQVFEISKIYNILRGYMNVLEIKFKTLYDGGLNINYDSIRYKLKQNEYVDQIIIDKTRKIIKVTKNPDDFITEPKGKGIIYKPENNIDDTTFYQQIEKLIQQMGYKILIVEKKETCFPEDKDEFERQFYNPEINKLKNVELIKRRIVGLTSYYGYQDKTRYPKLVSTNIEPITMSSYQLSKYEKYRHEEIEDDRKKKRHGDKEDNVSSTYRLYSRLACSFVFPEEIGSPYDNKEVKDKLLQVETLSEHLDNDLIIADDEIDTMSKSVYEKTIKDTYLKILAKDKHKYLDIKNGSLAKYSPKYLKIISNILKEEGKLFVYSNFLTLTGLNTFALALEQTGKWSQFDIKKTKVNNEWKWVLDIDEKDKDKHKYMFYTGAIDKTKREILRNIYNSEFDKLDSSCSLLVSELKKNYKNNYTGDVIKMLMTTKTGAEGLDLKEVRYIHIMEPYWQPVLITQIIGRGVRNGSHLNLPKQDRTVEVFLYMSTITPELVKTITKQDVRSDIYTYTNPALSNKAFKVVTSDEHLYMVAERKKKIVNEFQNLMKMSAFDCSINYSKNKLSPENENLICMDYDTENRDNYIYTPSIQDTIDTIDITPEKLVFDLYDKMNIKDKLYYADKKPNAMGKMYIYNENLVYKNRLPKPVGEIKLKNGKKQIMFYKKKK